MYTEMFEREFRQGKQLRIYFSLSNGLALDSDLVSVPWLQLYTYACTLKSTSKQEEDALLKSLTNSLPNQGEDHALTYMAMLVRKCIIQL